MAKDLEFFPNAVAPSADYPNGDVKDTPSGTPVNVATMGDVFQFFRKLMDEAGVTPNNLRDNTTNGWQIFDSLQIAAKPFNRWVGKISQTGTTAPTEDQVFENELGAGLVWTYVGVGWYSATLIGAFPANKYWGMMNNIGGGVATTNNNTYEISRWDNDTFFVFVKNRIGATTSLTDGLLIERDIEVRAYR